MNKELLIFIIEFIYFLLVLATIIKIIVDTRNPVKSLAYILFTVFVPVLGMFVYLSIGVNYRKKKFYRRKNIENSELFRQLEYYIQEHSEIQLESTPDLYEDNENTIRMLFRDSFSPLISTRETKLLINGENKFPEVIKAMEEAKDHIHVEYFIYNDDEIGNQLKDIMIKKVKEGVSVRFIYDDYGSHILRKRVVPQLKAAGVEVYPFYKIRLFALANSMNYRNHRKIIIVDGDIGFIGGINVDDRYINNNEKNNLFWRDTHIMLKGNAVSSLQFIFMSDWNFCSDEESDFGIESRYFPIRLNDHFRNPVQIAASGPDSINANIMLSCMGIITNSRKRLYMTTPYFIPNETIVDAIKYAALGGVDVRLLVPGVSDSVFVNAASCSYYEELLQAGVRIYRYQKGFVHAKTIVSDFNLSVIGTANMDIRSYDLMFEVNALVFNESMNEQLCSVFFNDLKDSIEITYESWKERNRWKKFGELCARLLSPLL